MDTDKVPGERLELIMLRSRGCPEPILKIIEADSNRFGGGYDMLVRLDSGEAVITRRNFDQYIPLGFLVRHFNIHSEEDMKLLERELLKMPQARIFVLNREPFEREDQDLNAQLSALGDDLSRLVFQRRLSTDALSFAEELRTQPRLERNSFLHLVTPISAGDMGTICGLVATSLQHTTDEATKLIALLRRNRFRVIDGDQSNDGE